MNKSLLYLLNLINKGWEVSLLALLPFIQQTIAISLFEVGLLSTLFVAFQIVASLLSGNLSQKVGNKSIILLSMVFFGLAWFLMSLSKDFILLTLVYSFGGIGAGLFEPMANSLIAKIALPNKRGQEIGNFGAFGDVGRIGVVAGVTLLAGLLGIGYTAIFCLFISFILILMYSIIGTTYVSGVIIAKSTGMFRDYYRNKKFVWAVIAGVLDSISGSSLYIFLPFLLITKGINISTSGLFTALFFFGYLSGRLLLSRLSDHYGTAKLLVISELIMSALILLLIVNPTLFLIIPNLFLLGMFTRGTSPIIRSMVSESIINKEDFDKGYSLYSSSTRFTLVPCRTTFGYLAGLFGISSVFYLSALIALATIYPAQKFKHFPASKGEILGG